MLSTIQGVCRKGKVELTEAPPPVKDEAKVMVTFLETASIDLKSRGIGKAQAEELRSKLMPFAEDWMSPEMDAYDHYDQAKTKLPAR